MSWFLGGLAFLAIGYFIYGKIIDRIIGTDDRDTPCVACPDSIDRIPLPKWKNALIQLLNIAGVGPVIGVILGIKFGKVALLIIPVGCMLMGAVHDFIAGMMSVRHNGANLPVLVRQYLGKYYSAFFSWVMILLLLLVVTVFINVPANIIDKTWFPNVPLFWWSVGAIFLYYIAATLFPVDKIIGKIYPAFGALLILGSAAVFIALIIAGLRNPAVFNDCAGFAAFQEKNPLFPCLFVTIACGIISGFHATQSPIVARTIKSEREAQMTFFGMMILEGMIAMIWAASALAIYNLRPENLNLVGPVVLGNIASHFLGPWIGSVTVIAVVVLAITSGDTALRSARLALAEIFRIDQLPVLRRIATTMPLVIIVALLLGWSNADAKSFNNLWNYFAWGNQMIAMTTLMAGTVWLLQQGRRAGCTTTLLPGMFMTVVVVSFILWTPGTGGQPIGLVPGGLPLKVAIAIGILIAIAFAVYAIRRGLAGSVGKTASLALAFLIAPAFGLNAAMPDVLYPDREFVRLPFNTSGTVEIGCGFCERVAPVDADGDGDWDLQVHGSGFGGGGMFYENVGNAFVFKKGVRGKAPFAYHRFSMLGDGQYALTAPDRITVSRLGEKPGESSALGVGTNNVHWSKARCNSWLTRDFDGDGRNDLLVGIGDWREYGWHNSYDGLRRAWTNANCRGLVYLLRNLGTDNGKTRWSDPSLVRIENGMPVETMGNAHPMLEDWDGDGDLDLIVSDFPGGYAYFENIGTRKEPVYASGRLLHDSTGALLATPECIPVPQAIDWDRDGRLDFIASQEDSRIGFYHNTGKLKNGLPVFDAPRFIRTERDDLRFGALVSPWVCDFDGDGDQDIVVGDAAGYLAWFENLSGKGAAQPKWEGPHYIECDAPSDGYTDVTIRPDTLQCRPFKHRAGYNGSIQGPIEAGFGYTCESVADWDGDGDLDIIYNSIWGKPMLLENIGTRRKPHFAAPRGIEVEWGENDQPTLKWEWLTPTRTGNPKEIVTQWRTTPIMIDWNRDGLTDLVMADTEGYLAYFERYRENGILRLKAPRRAFIDAKTGKPMGVTGWGEGNGRGVGGHSGRRKICLADWDGDGKLDLIMNGTLNAVVWTQTESTDTSWSFTRQGNMTAQPLQRHSTCPTACDFDDDGVTDLVLGAEDGYIYFLRNPRSR